MKLFDYFFYRVYVFYKRHRDSTPVAMACLLLSLVLTLSLLDIVGTIDKKLLPGRAWMVIIMLLFLAIFYKRYENKVFVNELDKQFSQYSALQKNIFGAIVVVYIILSIGIPVAVGIKGGHVYR